jgi:C1A family cysteine protease
MNKFFRTIGFVIIFAICSSVGFSVNAATINAKSSGATELDVKSSTLPSSYSSRDLGYVTPIRNQGSTQTCWSISAVSAVETLLLKNGKITNSSDSWLSISHIDAWGSKRSDGTGWLRDYGKNGYPFISLGYLSSWAGPILENDFPFGSSIDNFDIDTKYDINYGITGYMYVDRTDTDTVKKCIMDYGSVVSNYNNLTRFYTYNMLNYYCPELQTTTCGHSIEIVGWDDNYSKENFTTSSNGETYVPNNDGAWLCKNSWGDSVGDDGYFWISYEDAYNLGDKYGPNYAFTDYTEIDDAVHLYQVQEYGSTYEFTYLDQLKSTNNVYMNVFDFKDNELLNKVLFETESVGADYTLYYIPMNSSGTSPDENTANWQTLTSGVVPYSGLISCSINNFAVSKGKAAIGVRIDTTDKSNIDNGVGVDEWLNDSSNEYIFIPDSKSNASYIYYKGKMQDVMDFYKEKLDDTIGGNLDIKAVTQTMVLGDTNIDGEVDIRDVTLIQKYICQLEKLTKSGYENADFNGDGLINIRDCTAIQKYITNISQ